MDEVRDEVFRQRLLLLAADTNASCGRDFDADSGDETLNLDEKVKHLLVALHKEGLSDPLSADEAAALEVSAKCTIAEQATERRVGDAIVEDASREPDDKLFEERMLALALANDTSREMHAIQSKNREEQSLEEKLTDLIAFPPRPTEVLDFSDALDTALPAPSDLASLVSAACEALRGKPAAELSATSRA